MTEGDNSPRLRNEESTKHDEGSGEQGCPSPPGTLQDADTARDQDENATSRLHALEIHRSCVCADMIRHFQDEEIMNSELVFTIINERGEREEGVGIGIDREVFSLFWCEFANSMTIGERERVPFIRHDHFIKEWEAIGRILVKGYISAILSNVPCKGLHLLLFI